jgi:hypothetical protein
MSITNKQTRDISETFADPNVLLEAGGEALDDAIQLHKKMGLPMAVTKNDRPAWVAPEELEQSEQQNSMG